MTSYSYVNDIIITANGSNAISLGQGDKVYLAQGTTISSSGSGSNAIIGPDGITATIAGDIFASYCGIITNTATGNSKVTVKATASIDADYGIYLNGTGNYVYNAGDVSGVYAVSFAAGNSYLQNTGNISGSFIGVQLYGTADTTNKLVNSGSIGGTSYGVYCSTAADSITNTGTISGTVNLGGGNDKYDGRLGALAGTAFGGLGDDRILTGANDDRIVSGQGLDTVTGGGGDDEFVFAEGGSHHKDVITDFKHLADTIVLDNSYFTKLVDGDLSKSNLRIGEAPVDSNDYLFYNAAGQLMYDKDPTGSTYNPFVIATLKGHPTLTVDDFQIA